MALSFSQQEKLSDLMLIRFQQLPLIVPDVLLTYAALEQKNEFSPDQIVDYLNFKNPELSIAYTVMANQSGIPALNVVLVDEDTIFTKNKYNIPEPLGGVQMDPKEVDVVLTPLLCFDKVGNRVGYGKGYYDRLFSGCREDVVKIGFSFFDAVDEISDINEYDFKLDYCVTPEKVYSFHN